MPTTCELKEGTTSRPNLLTEADLVGLMDRNGIGTDATIAEHIAKIIDRNYVFKIHEGATQYLVPSTLGMGLVEGYNAIGLDKSLSKPQLRRETEQRMTMICEGSRSKGDVLTQTIDEYREMFIRTRRAFGTIVEQVARYINSAGDPDADEGDGTKRGQGTRATTAAGTGPSRGSHTSTGGAGTSNYTCFSCNQQGHLSTSCPNKNGASSGGGTSSGPSGAGQKCFHCDQPGHWANACPAKGTGKPTGGVGGPSTSGQKCFHCDQPGHWANACPAKGLASTSAATRGTGASSRARGASSARGAGASRSRARKRSGPGTTTTRASAKRKKSTGT
ncbi:hypothetical protein PtA15_9A618 [Puccinia triticina]|uniref:DNA topoisomerase n=1 Tax=Puccinia triticina TaxID=208348 RepID=A0ABY7CT88_9BASI|nr:uncharacterized protein PtA15_9A618 [Puccinia triticina]WAQ88491.1 hypothetical protein PtA15_9A618 [Puccinia triticina]